jgi:hypothetical protein
MGYTSIVENASTWQKNINIDCTDASTKKELHVLYRYARKPNVEEKIVQTSFTDVINFL